MWVLAEGGGGNWQGGRSEFDGWVASPINRAQARNGTSAKPLAGASVLPGLDLAVMLSRLGLRGDPNENKYGVGKEANRPGRKYEVHPTQSCAAPVPAAWYSGSPSKSSSGDVATSVGVPHFPFSPFSPFPRSPHSPHFPISPFLSDRPGQRINTGNTGWKPS